MPITKIIIFGFLIAIYRWLTCPSWDSNGPTSTGEELFTCPEKK